MSSKIVSEARAASRRRPLAKGAAALLILAAVTASPSASRAEPSAADKAVAEALFREGKKLFDGGKTAEACAKLTESQRLDPKLGTLLNLAVCHEKEGKSASAWAEFTEAASLSIAAKNAPREAFAKEHASALEKRLSKLVIEISGAAPGTTFTLNGATLSAAAVGSPIPVDPGSITIAATAPGKRPWSETVTIEAGPSSKRIVVPPLADEPKVGPTATPTATVAASAGPVSGGSGMSGRRVAGIAVAAAGLVSVGVGSVFGVIAFQKKDALQGHCGARFCDEVGLAADRDAHLAADVSTATFAVGLAAIAGGAVLYFTAPSPQGAGSALRVTPQISGRGAGLLLEGDL